MAYIETGVNQPGIIELLFYKGATGKALSNLAHTLLHGPSDLSSGERELIASYVSKLNNCDFCHDSHTAAVNAHLGDNGTTVQCVIDNVETADISEKMKWLLRIAGKVQISGREVAQSDVDAAKAHGATDQDIHDTVLIAAAFCMYNRYVDGLGTKRASGEEYTEMGQRMSKGYKYPPLFMRKYVINMMNKKAAKG